MTQTKTQMDRLVETLIEAGVSRTVARKAEVIRWAKDDEKDNERVHAATNSLLLELLRKNELGTCIHVTGGARALTDPFHREVCEAMRLVDKNPFQVLYHLPEDVDRHGWGVVEWNLRNWRKKGFRDWKQKLRTLRMIGNRAVDLKSYDERESIQFSVFGNRYVQVQGRHSDEDTAKYVWLIESRDANELLAESAETDLRKSDEVDEGVFTEIVTSVLSNSARAMLHKVSSGKASTSEDLLSDGFIQILDPKPESTLEALQIMSFLNSEPQGTLKLTNDGADFLQSS